MKRTERIYIRLTREEKEALNRAAADAHMSLSSYVLGRALAEGGGAPPTGRLRELYGTINADHTSLTRLTEAIGRVEGALEGDGTATTREVKGMARAVRRWCTREMASNQEAHDLATHELIRRRS